MTKSRMFKFVKNTWNPVVGCVHLCRYCWARRQAKRQKKRCELCYRFVPHLHEERLKKRWRDPKLIFTVDMGDLFCSAVPDEWILRVLDVVRENPHCMFLFMTKNPARYFDFKFPDNAILGTTIETNRNYNVSKAPPPEERYEAMKDLDHEFKFVSIEPIMDFDMDVLVEWIRDIKPLRVAVGYDNYQYYPLVEPPLSKTIELIEKLNYFTDVEPKTLFRGRKR